MARREAAPKADTQIHFEVWCTIDGQRRYRRAESEADVPALVDEIAADLRHASISDVSLTGEAEAKAIETAIDSIEVVKVTLTQESVPVG